MSNINKIANNSDSQSLRERIYNDLRAQILSGKIEAGTRLVETTLAKELGVSRTPVREALHKLGLENLVQSIPRVGYLVNDMSEYEVDDLFATRAAIEQLVARRALERITREELDQIEKNMAKTDQIIRTGQTKKMIDLDTEFHEIICRASRSRRLYQIAQTLREHMLKFRKACLHFPEIARRARDDHFEILKAFRAKDPAKLDEAMGSHMAHTKKDILDHIRRLREATF
jgi:GntR family transcriptional regulator, rspAB operon transcriptional repressor